MYLPRGALLLSTRTKNTMRAKYYADKLADSRVEKYDPRAEQDFLA